MKLRIPDDWDSEVDGYCYLVACVPNSPIWKAVYTGIFYTLTWYHVWDKNTGSINGAKAIAQDVYESLCMANCTDVTNLFQRLIGSITGEVVTVVEDGQNVDYDYSEIGLGPRIDALSSTENEEAQNDLIALQIEAAEKLIGAITGEVINVGGNVYDYSETGLGPRIDNLSEAEHNALMLEVARSVASAVKNLDLATNITVNEACCNEPNCSCQTEKVPLDDLLCDAVSNDVGNADPNASGPY